MAERERGPLYGVIAAFFLPFLALVFPYLVLDDYRRTRALAASGARSIRDPDRAPRKRDLFFWGPAVLWTATLLAIPVARATGRLELAGTLVLLHIVSASVSLVLLVFGWMRRDKRTPEEKQAEFSVREAQVQAFFDGRDGVRKEAGVAVGEPPVPWIGRGVWARWFLVGFDEEQPGTVQIPPGRAGERASPVTAGQKESAPVVEVVGDWHPRKVTDWTPAPKPPEDELSAQTERVTTQTPSPFPFPDLSWPVCDGRLAVLIWEGNVGLPPDAIGLPMGVPEQIEALVTAEQGVPAWDRKHGWDGNAVFQCAECGRLYWRGFEV